MCAPKVKKQAPAASTTPTMQAADELELITDGLQDNAIGRAALKTAGKGAARPRASTTASPSGASTSGAGPLPGATPTAGTSAAEALGVGGRRLGSQQPFYDPNGSVQP